MPRKRVKQEPTKPRYVPPPVIERMYGLGAEKLRNLRMRGTGPEFVKAGYRTVLYDLEKVETWLAQLPRGGGQPSK
jgi:hypothetical protein